MKVKQTALITLLGLLLASAHSLADVNVGVTVSASGPAASLGIPEKNTIALMPTTIAGQKINYIVLDDGSDTTSAVKNTRKLISENKVDLVLGSTTTPNSLAMIDVVAEAKVPMIAMAAGAHIVDPVDDKKRWIFKTPQNDVQMTSAIVDHMKKNGIKTVAFIGFADAYGDGWLEQFKLATEKQKLQLLAAERFNKTDTSVTGQALKVLSARPDAVLIAGAGTPAALPQKTLKERGYSGKIYQTHGVANNDFLRICGKDCEGTFVPVGPVLVADQLPSKHPAKAPALNYIGKYEAANGKGSVSLFGAYAWDAGLLLSAALPQALKAAKPGTEQFRSALRDALENVKEIPAAHGVFTMSANNHLGLDERSRVMVQIKDGKWVLVK